MSRLRRFVLTVETTDIESLFSVELCMRLAAARSGLIVRDVRPIAEIQEICLKCGAVFVPGNRRRVPPQRCRRCALAAGHLRWREQKRAA